MRRSGVLAHISSLPSEYSVGSFGRGAYEFVDMLASCGFKSWQVLPFCMTDECNSPYKSYSAFALNPYFIDLEILFNKGYITRAELDGARQKSPYLCEFDRLSKERLPLLARAAERMRQNRSEMRALDEFMEKYPELLGACQFLAIKETFSGAPWQEWKNPTPDERVLHTYRFIQYEFFNQWLPLKAYANSKGIEIIGDVPIYVAADSADVWQHPDQFLLDERGYPTLVAGVPPDYFSEDGQLWHNPLYNYKKMKEDGFAWWRRRLEYMLTLFDGVRIDHFRGFESFWAVPRDAKSAKEGRWIKAPGRDIIRALSSVAGDKLIIAEDLGDITPAVDRLRAFSGYPGMRVFQFAFLGDEKTPHLPHHYCRNTVAYSGTHDNNTLLGYIWEMDAENRKRVFDYIGYSGADWSEGCLWIIKALLASVADRVILPIQDILVYGSDTRMNTPGVASGNWAYRVTPDQLSGIDRERLSYLNRLYGRATEAEK